jgi:phytoene dehydrogenase-like protein
LTGLVTAALLGRRGLRVLVCGIDRPPATWAPANHRLPVQPGLLPTPEAEPAARVWRELNCLALVHRRTRALHPALQIVLPRHRFDIDSTPDTTERELGREFPAETQVISDSTARLQTTSAVLTSLLTSDITLSPSGFWERRQAARARSQLPPTGADLLAPLGAAHPFRGALAALGVFGSRSSPACMNATIMGRAWDVARGGLLRVDDGGAGLRALLLERIATVAGEVREATTPVELSFQRRRVVALRVRPRDELIGLDHLVWAGSAAMLAALCGDATPRKLREIALAVRPSCYRYTLMLLVHRDALPEGMGEHVIRVRDPAQPPLEDNALEITVGAPSGHAPDEVPVWVDCLVPATAVAAGHGYLAVVRARVLDELGRLMPFYERHLLMVASPHDGLAPELHGARAGGPQTPSPPPLPMEPAFTWDFPKAMAVAAAPHTTGLKNVYLASAENLPGLGQEGPFVAGWDVARLITGSQPRRDLTRRPMLVRDA